MQLLDEGHTATCIQECQYAWVAGGGSIAVLDLDQDAAVREPRGRAGRPGPGRRPRRSRPATWRPERPRRGRQPAAVPRVRLVAPTTCRWTRRATPGSSAATGRSASTRDPRPLRRRTTCSTPKVVARTGPDALADGELSCDGVNEDGTPEEGCEDDGDTLNDFIHHNSWRPDARQFKSRKDKDLNKKGVRPGETVLITEEDIWSRATQGTTKGGCETQGSFQTWQVKQLKATGEDESTVKPLDSYTTEFNELIEGDDVEGMDLIPTNGFCSSHYFDEHDGLVATAWYEQGTRLLDVRDPEEHQGGRLLHGAGLRRVGRPTGHAPTRRSST